MNAYNKTLIQKLQPSVQHIVEQFSQQNFAISTEPSHRGINIGDILDSVKITNFPVYLEYKYKQYDSDTYFTPRNTFLGECRTFNDIHQNGSFITDRTGSAKGLTIIYRISQEEYSTGKPSAGVKVSFKYYIIKTCLIVYNKTQL